jgi:trk system potassium uptake protein TrkA
MYIIIAGCNSVGASLVNKLAEDGNDVAVIDRDEENFVRLGDGSNCMTVTGMPIDEDVLKEAGIEKADAVAAVTSDDNINIMVAQIAKQLYHVPYVITKMDDPEKQKVMDMMGLMSVCPGTLAVKALFEILRDGGDLK